MTGAGAGAGTGTSATSADSGSAAGKGSSLGAASNSAGRSRCGRGKTPGKPKGIAGGGADGEAAARGVAAETGDSAGIDVRADPAAGGSVGGSAASRAAPAGSAPGGSANTTAARGTTAVMAAGLGQSTADSCGSILLRVLAGLGPGAPYFATLLPIRYPRVVSMPVPHTLQLRTCGVAVWCMVASVARSGRTNSSHLSAVSSICWGASLAWQSAASHAATCGALMQGCRRPPHSWTACP
jgi:hypothetical protein